MTDFRMCDLPGCNAIRGSVSCVERHTGKKIILFEGEKKMSKDKPDPIFVRISTNLKELCLGDIINIKGKVIDCIIDGTVREILVKLEDGIEKVEPKKKKRLPLKTLAKAVSILRAAKKIKRVVVPNDDDMNLRSY